MDKSSIRNSAIATLKEMSDEDKQTLEQRQAEHLFESTWWLQAKTIGITVSQGFEWDTSSIIKKGWEQGKKMCVPKCDPKTKALTFYQLDSFQQLEKSFYNLQEPVPEQTRQVAKQSMDLIIVPGLVFDRRGYRIGFGGGYYDRFLSDFPNQTISITSDEFLTDKVPAESFDLPVQAIITEKGVYTATGGETLER